jgi:hypothetical protein
MNVDNLCLEIRNILDNLDDEAKYSPSSLKLKSNDLNEDDDYDENYNERKILY